MIANLRPLGLALALFLGGCAGLFKTPTELVDAQAREARFLPVTGIDGPIKAWLRASAAADGDAPLTVYIEGDGAEWRSTYHPPRDPTPHNALTLRLALRDAGTRAAYLGRPCMYLDETALAQCPPALWVMARYGDTALNLINAAIDELKRLSGARGVQLVGFSGGGAIATLSAARRADVACVVTLGAPLDTRAWVAAKDLTPLRESFNPLDFAGRLRFVPQWHFAGEGDDIVPPATLKQIAEALPYARFETLKGYDHDCCWVLAWDKLRERTCLAGR